MQYWVLGPPFLTFTTRHPTGGQTKAPGVAIRHSVVVLWQAQHSYNSS